MPRRLWCFADDIQWGDKCTYDAALDRMVPTIGPGSEIDVELLLGIPELKTFGFDVYSSKVKSEVDLVPALEEVRPEFPLYRFMGAVKGISPKTVPSDPDPDLRRRVFLFADLDCGFPICLAGEVAQEDLFLTGERWQIAEGRWIEGITTLWANVSWPESPWRRIVKVAVEKIEESSPLQLHGHETTVRILTVGVIGPPRQLSAHHNYLNPDH